MAEQTPWWNDEDDKVTNVIRFIDNTMQDDEGWFLATLARCARRHDLSDSELGQVARHFTDRWQRNSESS